MTPEEDRLRQVAHATMVRLRKSGAHVTGPCLVCGTTKRCVDHHPDYTRPDWTLALCTFHHAAVHRGRIPEPVTGKLYTCWMTAAAKRRAGEVRARCVDGRRIIRALRKRLTDDEIAARIGASRAYLRTWFTDGIVSKPMIHRLHRLSVLPDDVARDFKRCRAIVVDRNPRDFWTEFGAYVPDSMHDTQLDACRGVPGTLAPLRFRPRAHASTQVSA